MSNQKSFRVWLQEMWFEHKEELASFNQKCDYNVQDYFNRYKYWLKREYRHQTKEQ